jgi:hypothetical protein
MRDGHKSFHLAEITVSSLWTDYVIEVDCGGNRVRMTSVISYPGGDSSLENSDVNIWHTLEPGAQLAGADLVKTRDLVCKYPDQKPTGNTVLDFPDFQTALERVSALIEKNRRGK